jgi:hypothetical protein
MIGPKGQLLHFGRGLTPGNPITNEIELGVRLQELCGAEGYRVEGTQVLALRWDKDGNEVVIDRFELQQISG